MKTCLDGYPGCRHAEKTGKWCDKCVIGQSNYMVVELLRSIEGLRFNSEAGERKTIRWRKDIPRIVSQCRENKAIDWGGASVQSTDYKVIYDVETTHKILDKSKTVY